MSTHFDRDSRRDGGDMDDYKVYVGGLSFGSTDASLRSVFGRCGSVRNVQIVTDRETGRSKGFGFITFDSKDSVQEAIRMYHQQDVDGRVVSVSKAMRPEEIRAQQEARGGGGAYGGSRDRYDSAGAGGGYSGRGYDARDSRDSRGGGGRDSYHADNSSYRAPPRSSGGRTQGYRVIATGLPDHYTWRELKDFLRSGAGNVTYANIKHSGTGVGEFPTESERVQAIRNLSGTLLDGRKVYLEELNDGPDARGPVGRDYGAAASPPRGGGASDYDAYGGRSDRGGGYGGSGAVGSGSAGYARGYDAYDTGRDRERERDYGGRTAGGSDAEYGGSRPSSRYDSRYGDAGYGASGGGGAGGGSSRYDAGGGGSYRDSGAGGSGGYSRQPAPISYSGRDAGISYSRDAPPISYSGRDAGISYSRDAPVSYSTRDAAPVSYSGRDGGGSYGGRDGGGSAREPYGSRDVAHNGYGGGGGSSGRGGGHPDGGYDAGGSRGGYGGGYDGGGSRGGAGGPDRNYASSSRPSYPERRNPY